MQREEMTLTDQIRDEIMSLYAAGGNDDFKDDMKSIVFIDSLLTAIERRFEAAQKRISELEAQLKNEKEKEEVNEKTRPCEEVNEAPSDRIATVKGFLG